MADALIPVLIFVGIFAIVGVALLASYWNDKKRTQSLEELASTMGLEFFPAGDGSLKNRLASFHLFSQGRARKLGNLIVAETADVRLSIFDYQYTVGSGKNSHTWKQTVAAIESPAFSGPPFALRPETLLQRIIGVLGAQDIDFESHPTFSQMFSLKSSAEEATREFFDPSILSFLETKPKLCVEAIPTRLVMYYNAKRIKPGELKGFLEDAYHLYGLLVERCAAVGSGAKEV